MKRYKIQYFENGYLMESDWTDINVPIKPPMIQSAWFQETLTQAELQEFSKQFNVAEGDVQALWDKRRAELTG